MPFAVFGGFRPERDAFGAGRDLSGEGDSTFAVFVSASRFLLRLGRTAVAASSTLAADIGGVGMEF
jgi:hypothetical protein